jgi:hypothetical protein
LGRVQPAAVLVKRAAQKKALCKIGLVAVGRQRPGKQLAFRECTSQKNHRVVFGFACDQEPIEVGCPEKALERVCDQGLLSDLYVSGMRARLTEHHLINGNPKAHRDYGVSRLVIGGYPAVEGGGSFLHGS